LLADLRKKYEPMRENLLGIELGLAINIDTPNTDIYPYLSRVDDEGLMPVDFVQFMGIRKIGYQGEPFAEEVYGKIRELRAHNPDIIISVDGGVNLENAPILLEAGANRLIAGSAVFDSDDIKSVIEKFKKLK
jgi:ribulose-phosphate 3-epimerase